MPLPRDDLLAFIREHGGSGAHEAEARLDRWVRKGLIPGGEQVHLTGREGSASLYPDDTIDLLCALIDRHRSERRLDELALWLWWDRLPVPVDTVRGVLGAFAAESAKALEKELGAAGGDLLTLAERFTVQAVGKELAGSTARVATSQIARRSDVRAMRKRVTSETDFLTAVLMLLQLAVGETPDWETSAADGSDEESSPAYILATLIGAPHVAGCLQERLAGALVDIGVRANASLPQVLASLCETAPESELSQARDITRSLIENGGQVVAAIKAVGGGKVRLGLDFLRTLHGIHGEPRGKWWRQRAMLILATSAFIRTLSDDGKAALRANCAAFDTVAPIARVLLDQYRHADADGKTRMRAAFRESMPTGFSDRLPEID